MELWYLSCLGLVALLAVVWLVNRQTAVLLRTIAEVQPRDTPPPALQDYDDEWARQAIAAAAADIQQLFQAVADGIDHVDRNEKRVRGIVLGAKRRFEASEYYDPGVDAEADTLPLIDEAEREPEELRLLSEGVDVAEEEVAPDPWGSVPGGI